MAKARRKVRTIICKGCGRTITRRMSAHQKYCSSECHHKHITPPNPKNGREVSCEWCGKTFYASQSRLKSASHYFCSNECQIAWQGRNRIKGVCKICGKTFSRSPSYLKRGTNEYCSNDCRYASEKFHQQAIEMNRKQQTLSPNRLEQRGYDILDSLDIDYSPQYLIGNKICVDAFIPQNNLIIQFDGDYWHGHPERFPNPDSRQLKRMTLDKSQDAYLKTCGFQVVRFWGSDIKYNPDKVIQRIQETLGISGKGN